MKFFKVTYLSRFHGSAREYIAVAKDGLTNEHMKKYIGKFADCVSIFVCKEFEPKGKIDVFSALTLIDATTDKSKERESIKKWKVSVSHPVVGHAYCIIARTSVDHDSGYIHQCVSRTLKGDYKVSKVEEIIESWTTIGSNIQIENATTIR